MKNIVSIEGLFELLSVCYMFVSIFNTLLMWKSEKPL